MKKIFFVSALIIFIALIMIFNKDSNQYQLTKLENGELREKMVAANFMGQSKNIFAVPLLMEYIHLQDDLYPYKNKSPESLSCVITVSLSEITSKNIGDTCCYYQDCKKNNQEIINKWRDWYKNEYPAWLEEQKKKNENL